jgi:hypothetical protein
MGNATGAVNIAALVAASASPMFRSFLKKGGQGACNLSLRFMDVQV